MILFRNLHLHRILNILLIFAMLFSHIQLLYACDSMADKPKHICCCGEHSSTVCPMATNCAMNEQVEKTACCEISYDILNDHGVMKTVSTAEGLTLLLNHSKPPPDIGFSPSIQSTFPLTSRFSPFTDESQASSPDSKTYLLTRRLRL